MDIYLLQVSVFLVTYGRYMTDKIPMGRTGKLDEVGKGKGGVSLWSLTLTLGRTPLIP